MTKFKPLTPSFRQDINIDFDKQIADLQTCEPNALVNAQIEALRAYKRLINGLPDGYPMPLADRKRGEEMKNALEKATQLPKGHGRLIERGGRCIK